MKMKTGRNVLNWIKGDGHKRMGNGEVKKIYEWSVQQRGNYNYPEIDKNSKSYFVLHNEDVYMKEYGAKTIGEVRIELERMWSGDACMEKIIMPVAVSIMKGMPNVWKAKPETKDLDDYIYIF